MALVDYFLKLDGVDGESADATHKNEIEVAAYSWGEAITAGGSGVGTGRVQAQDFSFVKRVDKASPELFIGCAMATHYKSAILTGRKSGGTYQDTLRITMEDVQITSYQQGGQGSSDAPPTDQVTLNFAKLELSYKTLKPDGTLDTEFKRKYDFAAGKKA